METNLSAYSDEQKNAVRKRVSAIDPSLCDDVKAFADMLGQAYPGQEAMAPAEVPPAPAADLPPIEAEKKEDKKEEKLEPKVESLSEFDIKLKDIAGLPDLAKEIKSKAEDFLAKIQEVDTEKVKLAKEISDFIAKNAGKTAEAAAPAEPAK